METQSISSELWRLAQVFLHFPGNKEYPFRHTFLNSSQTWSQNAGAQLSGYDYVEAVVQASKVPGGAGRFVPIEAIGFTGLYDRVREQDTVIKRHTELMQEFSLLLEGRKQECKKAREMLSAVTQEQAVLLQQLLQVLQKLDSSEQTIATEWHNGKFHRTDGKNVEQAVMGLEKKMYASSPTGLVPRTVDLSKTASGNGATAAEPSGKSMPKDLPDDDEYFDQIHTFLRDHQLGVKQMQAALLKIQRDVEIMSSGRSIRK